TASCIRVYLDRDKRLPGAVYLVEQAAVTEVDFIGLVPASCNLVDGEQVDIGEPVCIVAGNRFQCGAVEVPGRYFLTRFGVQIAEIGFGNVPGALARGILI